MDESMHLPFVVTIRQRRVLASVKQTLKPAGEAAMAKSVFFVR
jgi:hypothetical protein